MHRAWSATQSGSRARKLFDFRRVLDGDRGDDRQRQAAHAREGEDVGLQAGAGGRVRGRERENGGGAAAEGSVSWRGATGENAVTLEAVPAGGERSKFIAASDRSGIPSGRRVPHSTFSEAPAFSMSASAPAPQAAPFRTWMCLVCGLVYDEQEGWPDDGIVAGTRWEDVPANWCCPECGARKDDFEMVQL